MAEKKGTIKLTKSMYKEQIDVTKDVFSGKYSKVCVAAGRRAGKSYTMDRCALGWALSKEDKEVLWCTPSHSQSQEAYDRIESMLRDVNIAAKFNASTSDRKITFKNGSKIKFKSANKFNNLRGNNPDYVILDELAFFPEGALEEAIEPYMISNVDLVILAASTFNGKDKSFYPMWEEGNSSTKDNEDTVTHRLHYSMNPKTNYKFIEKKRKSLPKQVFDQEYEGIAVFGNSSVFGSFLKVQTVKEWQDYKIGHNYFYGIDVSGKGSDKTILTIIDGSTGETVLVYQVKAETGKAKEQIKEIKPILLGYKGAVGYVEVNGLGQSFYDILEEELMETDVQVETFFTTNPLKLKLVSRILLDINDGTIKLPNIDLCPLLDSEMTQYQVKQTPTGSLTYGHPDGTSVHDDTVDSLMMANYARYELCTTGQNMYTSQDVSLYDIMFNNNSRNQDFI